MLIPALPCATQFIDHLDQALLQAPQAQRLTRAYSGPSETTTFSGVCHFRDDSDPETLLGNHDS